MRGVRCGLVGRLRPDNMGYSGIFWDICSLMLFRKAPPQTEGRRNADLLIKTWLVRVDATRERLDDSGDNCETVGEGVSCVVCRWRSRTSGGDTSPDMPRIRYDMRWRGLKCDRISDDRIFRFRSIAGAGGGFRAGAIKFKY